MKSWLRNAFSLSRSNRPRTRTAEAKRRQRPLVLETLEDRVVPTLSISLQTAGVNLGAPTVVASTASDFTAVDFTGTYGDFRVTIFGGSSDTSATLSDLLSSTTSVRNLGASTATLNLIVFQDNYTLPAGSPLAVESGLAGSVNQGTLTLTNIFQASASSTNNTSFDFTNGPQTAAPTGSTFQTGSATGLFNRSPGNPYALSSTVTINLSAGGQVNFSSHVNVTPTPTAALGDFVWLDKNANGIQEAGEPGINGVTVNLLDSGNNVIATTTTGAGSDDATTPGDESNGFYQFTGLTPGVAYHVQFINPDSVGPDAYIFSPALQGGNPALDSNAPVSGNVVLSSGEFNRTLDAGLYRNGSIHAFGFLDINGNGIQDGGDSAFPDNPGKTFVLTGPGGTQTRVTVSGQAHWESLTPGTYTITENPIPPGYALTTTPNTRTFTVNSGEELVYTPGAANLPSGDTRTEVNLTTQLTWGNTQLAKLGDFVWEDKNADGIQQAGEPGINGVTVNLLDSGNNVIATTTTGAGSDDATTPGDESNGFYQFTGLMPGVAYHVQFINPDSVGPDAYIFSPALQGGNPALDSNAPVSGNVVLSSGEFNRTLDAGLYRNGSIHAFGFLDINGNGIQDGGDSAFPDNPGKTFVLTGPGGTQTRVTVSGQAHWESLTPGTYTITENPIPPGYALTTTPNTRTFTVNSGEELVYTPGAANLPSGDTRTEVNLTTQLTWGNTQLAKLGDFVWEDKNADGIQQAGEPGINGVTVNLLDSGNNVIATTTTGAGSDDATTPGDESNGFYQFTGLMPGVAYHVQFINPDSVGPDAYIFSPALQGGNPALDSNAPVSGNVVLSSGEFNRTLDAGLYRNGSIHAFGFLDINGDGIQNGGDSAFPDNPGKTLVLTGPGGTQTQVTVSGKAHWESLTPGTYTITENPIPPGYALTTLPNTRTFTVNSGEELVYTPGAANLPQGDTRTEVNLTTQLTWGNTQLAKLGDFVWEDKNADGIQQAGEPGINGVTVQLLDAGNNVIATTTTANNPAGDDATTPGNESNGFYQFTGLTPGVAYHVQFINPDSVGPDAYIFSPALQGGNPALDSNAPVSGNVVLSSGEFNRTLDAGLYRNGSIHAFGFLDINGDGIQNGGDSAFPDNPGKTLVLTGPGGTQTRVTVSGAAHWESLTPGTYTITENPIPPGYALTTTPNTRTFTVNSGEELVYTPGAANLPSGDTRTEVNLGTQLKWGNTQTGNPDLLVTKVADQGSVQAGSTIGFTVTITNTGGGDATGVKLQDNLPPGSGGDIFWTIDPNTGNPSAFAISGPKGSQVLTLAGQPITLAAGASLSVHITSPTNAADVSGGAVGVQSGVNPVDYLGAASDYGVLYIVSAGTHTLQITNVTIGANIGVGKSVGGTGAGKVSFGGPGTITGRLDFEASAAVFNNNNGSNVGPASVNFNVAAVTSAISTVTNLSSSLAGFGTPLVISGTQTINESAGQLVTLAGVSYRVFNVTSYSGGDGKLVTINGDGSGNPVVFNFSFNSNVNLRGDTALTGNGLNDDKVIWNFTTTGKDVSLNNNASSYPGLAFHGIILAPRDKISLVNANLSGRVFGGNSSDMQIVSGVTLHAPVVNTATVTASNVAFDDDDSSSAGITITGAAFKPQALMAAGTGATGDEPSLGSVNSGVYYVSVDGLAAGNVGTAELARVENALATLNGQVGGLGVSFVEADATNQELATLHIHFADNSVIGGAAQGVLGVTLGGDITIVNGWNWYLGAAASQVGAGEYDLQTIITHELGHAMGLGHSGDAGSVMYWALAPGEARRSLTAADLRTIGEHEHEGAEALMASPFAGNHSPSCGCAGCTGAAQASRSAAASTSSAATAGGGSARYNALSLTLLDASRAFVQGGGDHSVLVGGLGDDLQFGDSNRDRLVGGFGTTVGSESPDEDVFGSTDQASEEGSADASVWGDFGTWFGDYASAEATVGAAAGDVLVSV